MTPLLTDSTRAFLNRLLVNDSEIGCTRLVWLRTSSVSNSPRSIIRSLEKLKFIKCEGVARWKFATINPNGFKILAQIARRSSAQALERAPEERRYSILLAFVQQAFSDIADEIVDMFDRYLGRSYTKAKQD